MPFQNGLRCYLIMADMPCGDWSQGWRFSGTPSKQRYIEPWFDVGPALITILDYCDFLAVESVWSIQRATHQRESRTTSHVPRDVWDNVV